MKVALASALLACAFAVPAHAEDCKHTAHRTANSAGPDIERVVVEAGAGDLVVRGGQGRDVKVDGKACASSAKLLDEIKLEIRRDGNTVYVRTVLPEMSGGLFGFSHYAHMDVTVAVPKTATLKIEDSSGDMEVTDVQAAAIQDSSGDQTLQRIAGDLEVQDSSGEIKIAGVGGGLRLQGQLGRRRRGQRARRRGGRRRQLGRPRHPPRYRRRAHTRRQLGRHRDPRRQARRDHR